MTIFFQVNGPGLLPLAVQCAKRYAKDIAVICDRPYVTGVTVIPIEKVNQRFLEFEKVYRHRSPNESRFQTICIQRWIAARRALRLLGLSKAFFADSDCLVCCEPLETPHLMGTRMALTKGAPGISTAGMCLQSSESLDLFETFAFGEFFTDRYWAGSKHLSSDMSIWTALSEQWPPGIKLGRSEMTRIIDGTAWDHHLGVTHGYRAGPDGGKDLHFRDHRPFATTLDGAEVRLLGMHCWGSWKPKMGWYLQQLERS